VRQLDIGDIIDGFAIQELLHTGAAARLYIAQDSLTSHSVVLKIPLDNILNHPIRFYHYQNEEFLSRYLNHPAIVRFLVRQTSRLYLVQEYIAGQDLKTILHVRRQFPLNESLSVCLNVCEALAYLHSKSILHLDLKPENIMIPPTGGIKLIDFGLARHLGLRDYLSTDFSGPQGTPYYISPEQLCGNRNSKQSDIYSLGIVFYEMLTGYLPFKRSDKIVDVEQRLYREPVPPRYFDESIPAAIQQIVLKMLKRNIKERYQNIAELQHDLQNYEKLEPTEEGRKIAKPSSLLSFFKPKDCSIYNKKGESQSLSVPFPTRQILGCVMDDDSSNMVVEEAKREALVHGGTITLLVVLEEDIAAEEVDYAHETVGAQLVHRLDGYISNLNKYQLPATLRIKRGNVADNIIDMAESLDADIILLGPPRLPKGLSKISAFFGGSTIDKVSRSLDRNVRVLKAASPGPWLGLQQGGRPAGAAEENLRLFLADTWVYHLNRLGEAVNQDSREMEPSADACPYGEWLEKFVHHLDRENGGRELLEIHGELHRSIDKIAALKAGRDDFREIYRNETFPLSHRFKQLLQGIGSSVAISPAVQGEGR
jgi:serine/threonine protein kinase